MKQTISFCSLVFLLLIHHSVAGQFQTFADSYGLLTTIAGKGVLDDRSNGWLSEYEQGNATDAELSRPHFAMADAAGNIYIADKEGHGIRKVLPGGKIFTIAGTSVAGDNGDGLGHQCQLHSPNGLWVKADGTVYILDLGNNKVRKLSPDSTLVTVFEDQDGIHLGRGIWVSPEEDSVFYASGTKVKVWTAAKGVEDYASGFLELGNITMDTNGYLVVTDRSQNLVYRISKDGETNTIIAGDGSGTSKGTEGYLATETGIHGVRGVWFLEDNTFFVATHEGSQIWYIDYSGMIYLFLNGLEGDANHSGDGENFRTPGFKISEPRSVSVDYDGNVIVVENDRGFVRKIDNDYTYYYTNMIHELVHHRGISIYPNPVDSEARLTYHMNESQHIKVSLFSMTGAALKTIFNGKQDRGFHSHTFNTTNLPDGLYYILISENKHLSTEKLWIRH